MTTFCRHAFKKNRSCREGKLSLNFRNFAPRMCSSIALACMFFSQCRSRDGTQENSVFHIKFHLIPLRMYSYGKTQTKDHMPPELHKENKTYKLKKKSPVLILLLDGIQ